MNQVRAMMRSIALEMESDDVVRTHLGLRLAERNKAAEAAQLQRSVSESEAAAAAAMMGHAGSHLHHSHMSAHPHSGHGIIPAGL